MSFREDLEHVGKVVGPIGGSKRAASISKPGWNTPKLGFSALEWGQKKDTKEFFTALTLLSTTVFPEQGFFHASCEPVSSAVLNWEALDTRWLLG